MPPFKEYQMESKFGSVMESVYPGAIVPNKVFVVGEVMLIKGSVISFLTVTCAVFVFPIVSLI